MGNLWTVQQSTGNLTSSGTALFRGDVQTLDQFLGDGGALDNVVYSVNSQEGALSVVGAGTVSIFTNAGTITVSGASSLTELTTISGYLQGQIDAVEASDVDSINGALGVLTLQGSDFINVSTVGQTLTVSADAIVGGTNITVVSGASTVTIHGSAGAANALIGTDGITVISGSPFTTISGFRSEFVLASGFLQTGIDNSLQNVVEDLTPQLGGHLDVNGFDLVDSGNTVLLTLASGSIILTNTAQTTGLVVSGPDLVLGAADDASLSADGNTTVQGVQGVLIDATGPGAPLNLAGVGGIWVASATTFSGTTTVQTPTLAGHAATKAYVDGIYDEVEPALVGADGITITSGISTTTITGFRGEFVAASGFLQGQIDTANADVSSLNGLQGALNIVGDSFIGVTAAGSSINLVADAIVGVGTVSVISGSNSVTVSGAAVVDKQFTAIGAVSQYDLVYITSSGNRVAAARADSASTLEVIGMALAGAASGATVNVRLHGVVEGASGGATIGSPLFLSSTSAGDFTDTPPTAIGSFILQVGHAVNSADFYVNVNSATAIENSYETVPVLSINSVSGTITLAGAGQTSIVTQGQTITVNTPLDHAIVSGSPDLTVVSGTNRIIISDNNRALIGADGITVTSGTNTITLTGFRTEFVTASGFIQGQINNLDSIYATDAHLLSVSGHLQTQITTYSDHGNLLGLADDDHLQYFRTSATSETTRIVGGNDLLFQSDGSRGVPGSVTTLSIDGATGNLDTLGTIRVRGLTGVSLFDGEVVIGDLTVTGTQTIFNSVTDVVNHLTVSGSATIGDPDTPFEDKLLVRGDTDMVLDASRSADTVLELTHSGSAGSLDISGINNGFTWWKITNRGDATFRDLTVTGTATFTGATAGIDHGQLAGLADDDHTQYILATGARPFSGTVQANASGTIDIGTPSVPFDEVFGTPVVREFVAVSGSPRRGMIAIDFNDQFVAYNGSAWIILG